jgi:hypothetical protein
LQAEEMNKESSEGRKERKLIEELSLNFCVLIKLIFNGFKG